jgi:hypothetical protein
MNLSKALFTLATTLLIHIGLCAQDHVINGYYITLKGEYGHRKIPGFSGG